MQFVKFNGCCGAKILFNLEPARHVGQDMNNIHRAPTLQELADELSKMKAYGYPLIVATLNEYQKQAIKVLEEFGFTRDRVVRGNHGCDFYLYSVDLKKISFNKFKEPEKKSTGGVVQNPITGDPVFVRGRPTRLVGSTRELCRGTLVTWGTRLAAYPVINIKHGGWVDVQIRESIRAFRVTELYVIE